MKNKLIPVLITTDNTKRGVFAGYIDPADFEKNPENVTVMDVRMVIYWSTDVKGVLGLAATGPTKSCRITKAVPKALIKGITAIMELSPEAVKAWESEPWAA